MPRAEAHRPQRKAGEGRGRYAWPVAETPPAAPAETTESLGAIVRKLGATVWAAGLTLVLPFAGILVLWANSDRVREFWQGVGDLAPVFFGLAFGVVLGFSLLATWIVAVFAGFLFGFQVGTGAAMGAIVLGSAIGYGVGVLVSGDKARRLVKEHPRWQAVEVALLESGFMRTLCVVALIRLPSTPYAMTNLAMSALRAPLVPYVLGTLLGAAPRTALWVTVGRGLHSFQKDEVQGASLPWWVVGLSIAGVFVVLGILGVIAKHAMERVTVANPPRS